MPEAVVETPAVSSTVTEPVQHESFADEMKSWTSEQRDEWQKSGKEPEAPTAAERPVIEEKPAPIVAKIEPAAGAGEEDQDREPEYFGTPEQQARQKHAYWKKSQKIAALNAELKVLRELRAEKPAVTAAAQPKAEPKADEGEPDLELPDMNSFEGTPEGLKAYQDATKTAIKKYNREMAAYDRQQNSAQTQHSQTLQQWNGEIETLKGEHGGPAVEAIRNLMVSLPMMGVLMRMKGGAQAYHYFAQNPEATAALMAETDIPGEFRNYEELAAAADKDPRLARQLGAAEALVRAEAKRVLSGSTKTPAPKPITVSQTLPPAARVDASSSGAAKDALAEANRMYEETGDHKYLVLINKLEDERDAERRKRKR